MTKHYFHFFIVAMGNHPFKIGLCIRLILMILLPILMDDGALLQGVKYTDIDYDVFTDAANHVSNGRSPFDRHTFRYTPFLAWVLSYASTETTIMTFWRHPKYFGKILFCIADALCGQIIFQMKQGNRGMIKNNHSIGNTNNNIIDALWWLYNPLPINICTRGSGESFIVLLPVLFTLVTVMSVSKQKRRIDMLFLSAVAGIIHGLAIHAKLYPIIYSASFMSYLSRQEQSILSDKQQQQQKHGIKSICDDDGIGWCQIIEPLATTTNKVNDDKNRNCKTNYPFPWTKPKRLFHLIQLWIKRLLFTWSSVLFLFFSMSTFGIMTYLAIRIYGSKSLEEGLLYHFSRVDHRHNYSMFWYWIYLARGRIAQMGGDLSKSTLSIMGKGLLVPQILLLLYASLGIAPYDLTFALFLQTFSFVTQNKVMTAQYFTWYLVLLPLCSDRIKWKTPSMMLALGLLGLSIVTWLGCAFCLEMRGLSFHLQVWLASVLFYGANVNLLRNIVNCYQDINSDLSRMQHDNKKKE